MYQVVDTRNGQTLLDTGSYSTAIAMAKKGWREGAPAHVVAWGELKSEKPTNVCPLSLVA
jgi:hypothetical protein